MGTVDHCGRCGRCGRIGGDDVERGMEEFIYKKRMFLNILLMLMKIMAKEKGNIIVRYI